MDQISFGFVVDGHQITISVKVFSILSTGFQSDVKRYIRETGHGSWRPYYFVDQISFIYFSKVIH